MDPVSALAPSSTLARQPSPLHSPIPYLFGSLSALMGLIAIAYIVFACSYWKLSRNFDDVTEAVDVESGNVTGDGNSRPENYNNLPEVSDHMQDKFLVIMAGEDKPTFLATPSSSRATSFGSSSWRRNLVALTECSSSSSEVEMMKEMMN